VLNLAKRLKVLWTIVLGIAVTSCGTATSETSCPKVGFTVVQSRATSETQTVKAGANQTLFIRRAWITTTSDISEIKIARPDYSENDGDVLILIKWTPVADQRLHDATTNHSGMRMAFMFDDEALLNFVWEGPYGMYTGGTQVSIQRGMNQAQKLMKAMRGCTGVTVGDRLP
jgi:hypothetical protein